MYKVHILIVDESPDFAKSLGNLILDVFGTKTTSVEYAYNVQDGVQMVSHDEFHFIFIRLNFTSSYTTETKSLFKQVSLNQMVRIVTLSFNGGIGLDEKIEDGEDKNCVFKDEIDADKLAYIFEEMR